MESPSWFEEIDHTGDAGVLVRAPDLKTLFERAAIAMFTILTEVDEVGDAVSREVDVSASDREDLLVRWLSELNFLHLTERMLFHRFAVRSMSDKHLSAEVSGEGIDEERHTVHTEIKAVTYHGLTISASEDGWSAQVIFDM